MFSFLSYYPCSWTNFKTFDPNLTYMRSSNLVVIRFISRMFVCLLRLPLALFSHQGSSLWCHLFRHFLVGWDSDTIISHMTEVKPTTKITGEAILVTYTWTGSATSWHFPTRLLRFAFAIWKVSKRNYPSRPIFGHVGIWSLFWQLSGGKNGWSHSMPSKRVTFQNHRAGP